IVPVSRKSRDDLCQIDGRHTALVEPCGHSLGPGLPEQKGERGRGIERDHSDEASRRRSAIRSSTTPFGFLFPYSLSTHAWSASADSRRLSARLASVRMARISASMLRPAL